MSGDPPRGPLLPQCPCGLRHRWSPGQVAPLAPVVSAGGLFGAQRQDGLRSPPQWPLTSQKEVSGEPQVAGVCEVPEWTRSWCAAVPCRHAPIRLEFGSVGVRCPCLCVSRFLPKRSQEALVPVACTGLPQHTRAHAYMHTRAHTWWNKAPPSPRHLARLGPGPRSSASSPPHSVSGLTGVTVCSGSSGPRP